MYSRFDPILRILGCGLLVGLLSSGVSDLSIESARGASSAEQLASISPPVADTIRSPKRVDLATMYGVGGTLLPVTVGTVLIDRANETYAPNRGERTGQLGAASLAIGLLVGPSLGHFYAHNQDQAWTGMAIRGGAVASGTLALWAYPFQDVRPTPDRAASSSGNESTVRGALSWIMVASGAVLVFRSFYDLVSTSQSVQDYNAQPNVRASLTPHVSPGGKTAGLTVRVQF